MVQHAVINEENKEIRKVELAAAVFQAPKRRQLLFDVVQGYLANKRQGTAKAKTRSEVAGPTGKKYRQKGGGCARHRNDRAPIFVGGGVAFPPLPRDWRQNWSQKARQNALVSALTIRLAEGNLIVVDKLEVKEIKTRAIAEQLKQWNFDKGVLVVEKGDEKLLKSLRNLPNIVLRTADSLNALDVIRYGKVLATADAVKVLENRLQ